MEPYRVFCRQQLDVKPLVARASGMDTQALLEPSAEPADFVEFDPKLIGQPEQIEEKQRLIQELAESVHRAKVQGSAIMITYGAHLIKNGAGTLLIQMMREGFISHLATNAAGAIHDWELAFFGQTTEDVRRYVQEGQFGIWHETGFYMNLAAILGWANGLGYGQALGQMVATNEIALPTVDQLDALLAALGDGTADEFTSYQMAGLRNLRLHLRTDFPNHGLASGTHPIPHPGEQVDFDVETSVLGTAYQLGIPVTIHKGLGYDIIDTHPLADGGAIGATGYRDFLVYTASQQHLDGGVYLCVGSAVMGPMVFEKAQSMVNNLRLQEGLGAMQDFRIVVNDIQPVGPEWRDEPTPEKPSYYHRFTKTFRRMGGEFTYFEADNRAFLHNLYWKLKELG